MKPLHIATIGLALTLCTPTSAAPIDLKKSVGKYTVYVGQGANEPSAYGSYSVRIFCDCDPGYQDGVISRRSGELQDWWVADIDADSQPEILIWIRGSGSGEVAVLDIFSLVDGKLRIGALPAAPAQMLKGYQGHDTYKLEQDGLIRGFPVYQANDSNARPTGGYRLLKFIFSKQQWSELREPTK